MVRYQIFVTDSFMSCHAECQVRGHLKKGGKQDIFFQKRRTKRGHFFFEINT